MTWDASLTDLLEDTITVEPFSAETAARAQTFGTAVEYAALIQRGAKRVIGPQGREVISNIQVYIPERVHIDQRSRVTLPSGFVPNQPPIIGIEPLKGLGLDHTCLYLVLLLALCVFPALAFEKGADAGLRNAGQPSEFGLRTSVSKQPSDPSGLIGGQLGASASFATRRPGIGLAAEHMDRMADIAQMVEVLQVLQPVVLVDPIEMVRFPAIRTGANEGQQYKAVNQPIPLDPLPVDQGGVAVMCSTWATAPRSMITSDSAGATVVDPLSGATERADFVEPFVAWNVAPLFHRNSVSRCMAEGGPRL